MEIEAENFVMDLLNVTLAVFLFPFILIDGKKNEKKSPQAFCVCLQFYFNIWHHGILTKSFLQLLLPKKVLILKAANCIRTED